MFCQNYLQFIEFNRQFCSVLPFCSALPIQYTRSKVANRLSIHWKLIDWTSHQLQNVEIHAVHIWRQWHAVLQAKGAGMVVPVSDATAWSSSQIRLWFVLTIFGTVNLYACISVAHLLYLLLVVCSFTWANNTCLLTFNHSKLISEWY